MKRDNEETKFEIGSLTSMMKESNMFDGGDEYDLLLEGYNCIWDEADCFYILSIVVRRYERYLRIVDFDGQEHLKYIKESIDQFLEKYKGENVWSVIAMEEMIEIDGEILEVVDMEGVKSLSKR
jgi:hypothetical protein